MTTINRTSFALTFALALTMMLGPFSLDTYLPAFPKMAEALGVDQQAISLSVSVYIFALALSQLIGGVLSDRYGRPLILLTGLSLFTAASVLLSQVESLSALLIGRVIQAFGAGWALVSVPALIRDRMQGQQAAKLFAMTGLIMAVAPAIAPGVGSLLLKIGPWGTIFIFQALYAVAIIPLLLRSVLRGAPQRAADHGNHSSLLSRFASVLSTRAATPYILWQTASFSIMMLFITYSSFIYQVHFQQSEDAFALLFAANILAMLGFNLLNRALLSRISSLQVLRMATGCQGLGVLGLLIAAFSDGSLYVFLPAMMLSIGAIGAITPNIQACYLEYFPSNSGTASSLLGASQFGVAGLLSGLSALLPHTLTAIVLVMAGCAVVSVSLMVLSLKKRPQ